jgi:hypothetical protein
MNRIRPVATLLIAVALIGLLFAPTSLFATSNASSPPATGPAPGAGGLNVSCNLTNGLSQWPSQSYNANRTNYTENVTIIWHKVCATPLFGDLTDNWGGLRSTMVNGTTEWTAENLTATGTSYPEVGLWELDWRVLNGTPGNRTWCHGEVWAGDVRNNTYTVAPQWNNDNCLVYSSTPLVTFIETGLPAGTAWTISINGTTPSATSGAITLLLLNGTYAYSVGNVPGFSPAPASGSVIVAGASVEVMISFSPTASPGSSPPLVLDLQPTAVYVILATAIAAVAILLAAFGWQRKRVPRPPQPPAAK